MSFAHAGLRFIPDTTEGGHPFVTVTGDFAYEEDLGAFVAVVRAHKAVAVVFNSPGGNVLKAMELGRLIRSEGLPTIQSRGSECSSACALAFLGGVQRFAQPGSIGVHRSSFSDTRGISVDDAVSHIQRLTADIMAYISEMGADPALLQLALQYDSADMRYLSLSEMAQFRVTTDSSLSAGLAAKPAVTEPPPTTPPLSSSPMQASGRFVVPAARSGLVRHPKGQAALRSRPDNKSNTVATLRNGAAVDILASVDRWFEVRQAGTSGFLHETQISVREYDGGAFEDRHVQIRSFDDYTDAEAFVRASSLPLAAYLVSNGWFAVTLKDTYSLEIAADMMKMLKSRGAVPEDAFVTYGNTYVRKVCCE
ncbi:SH3 domain-containing protein [Sinorhizobium terangae]|uniref:SH3 domain-containing protein n=1 Tax=Sinorhizobium terangae TaxID=110322 RepID=UPI0024B24E0E|nr:SH3 domain-containing protein [Sinorhizobium terangae]WFU49151.1 SH3 domain-containing protein [Sinorhizobium terangae]